MPDVLGQELFREAISDGSLTPFNGAVQAMETAPTPLERVNAFKAVRFGLAGLAIHGWQSTITQPRLNGPLAFGNTQLEYEFTPQYFPGHDHEVEGQMSGDYVVTKTQGKYALDTVKRGMHGSMADYLGSESTVVEGIQLADVIEMLRAQVERGHKLGLDAAFPEFYHNGFAVTQDVYDTMFMDTDEVDTPQITSALREVAGNTIRFLENPIITAMERFREQAMTGDEEVVSAALTDLSRHVIRASQRVDGNELTLRHQSETAQLESNNRGELVLTWPGKDQPPLKRLETGAEIPEEGKVLIATRNKCPVGYTPDAYTPMPGQKINHATFSYLTAAGLMAPDAFFGPKSVQRRIVPIK